MDVRYAATILVLFAVCSTLGCDRLSGGASEDGARARWAKLVKAHGSPPAVDEGKKLDGSATVAVLKSEETIVGDKTLAKNPTVMEVAQLLKDTKNKGNGWVVWTDGEIPVRRLARFVQKLEMAGDEPTVHLAVAVSAGEGDSEIRGIQLSPGASDELSAGNAWAAHAPAETKVADFLGTYRERLRSRGEKLEDFSE
ncbi:MAG: hypothetical protein ABEN55_10595 [Bradymonadaceae bacterium]